MTVPGFIPVLAAPQFDPGAGRLSMELPEGLTLAEIVAAALPAASAADLHRVRVALVSPRGASIIDPAHWRSLRPKPGIRVVIRVISGKNALRAVLSIVVSIAAITLGGWFAGPLLGLTQGTTAYAIAAAGFSAGVTLVGQLLINALIPPVKPDNERRNSYTISGWRNRLDPDGAVPVVLGSIRYAPPFAAMSWTEIIGDLQYVRALFLFGEGQLDLTDFRIGETSLSEFDEVEIELRPGLPPDAPVSLYPTQIVEETIGVELTRPLPRDDLGEVISGEPAIETPIVRTTGADASGASVILAFPGGLVKFNDEGRKRSHSVSVRIEQRLVTAEEWQPVTTLNISARKAESFYRQHTWSFPSRGRWQVRLIMLTDETDRSSVQQRTAWAALQTLRPEYPLAYPYPLALVALRVKATHQLNGALDNFSAIATRICPDWDHETQTWVTRATSNPASLYRYILQAPANPKRAADSGIDLALLQDWHDFCRLKSLTYNRVLDQAGMTFRDALTEVAAAGRATPRHDGTKWGVVIDRPQELIVDHVSPRNSWGFSLTRSYVEKPHAFVVEFQDETNDFKPAKRVVRRPGYEGLISLTEALPMPGVTTPEIVYREALRRFYEAQYRPDQISITQDGILRVATRGDEVALSSDILGRVERGARVRDVLDSLIEIDELVRMEEGQSYGIRFRVFEDGEDTIGMSVVRTIATIAGEIDVLTLTGTGPMPATGDLIQFGPAAQVSRQVKITGIEMTEDQCAILRSVAAAPEIDSLTDAAEIPPWSSRVGTEIDPSLLAPATPRFTSISSGVSGTDESGVVSYLIEPGSGTIGAASFRIYHRPGTSGDWTEVTIPAANGGGEIAAYDNGDTIQLAARGISFAAVEGPMTAPVTLVVGAGDAPIPAALDPEAISVTTLLGGALIQVATGEDADTTRLQVYRSTSAVLDRETDAMGEPYATAPLQSYSFALGDTTRATLIAGSTMDNPATWTLDAGWTVDAGLAAHTPGTADAIGQALGATAGKWYRIGYTLSGRTAGSITPRLIGGSDRPGTAVTANGDHADRIQAVSGNDTFDLFATSDLDGSVDDVVAYLETAACLSQGTHYVWLEPQNADGVPGPVSGPFTITII